MTVEGNPCGITKKFTFMLEFDVQRFSKFQNQVGPGIVTRPFVVWAGISQPYY